MPAEPALPSFRLVLLNALEDEECLVGAFFVIPEGLSGFQAMGVGEGLGFLVISEDAMLKQVVEAIISQAIECELP